ncbi:MAG: hypothetical protein H5T86_16700, partial [Armatimonadetes bacterium]|nr:hypothetical protein [Armatimonadota bacterium]
MAEPEDEAFGEWLEEAQRVIQKPLTAGNLLDYELCPRKFLLSGFA